jgi:hypothetical protein
MRHIILYAASCPACSEVAQQVRNASITDLEARPFEDPQVTESLATAGLVTPDRPSLVVISDTDVRVLSGWAMRRRLARLVGWRRSRTIFRLLAAEWRARLAAPAVSYTPSRRGLIGTAFAGIAGWVLTSGSPAAASPAPSGGEPAVKPADPADVGELMKTASAQRAIRTWGPAAREVLEVSDGAQPVLVLTHPAHDIVTFVDNLPGALASGNPVAVSMGKAPTTASALRYYTVGGVPLADVAASDGRVTASPVQPSPIQKSAAESEDIPDVKAWQIACFASCIGRKSGAPCILTCEGCFFDVTGTLAKIAACTNCFVCAGPNGVPCLRECAII